MKTSYVHQLPKLLQDRIYRDLQIANVRACSQEIEDSFEVTLNSRLCDLEEILDTEKFVQEIEFWKEIDRQVGVFEGGDIIWDIDGNTYVIMRKTDYSTEPRRLSAEDAKELYKEGNLQSICVEELILYFPDCISNVKNENDY